MDISSWLHLLEGLDEHCDETIFDSRDGGFTPASPDDYVPEFDDFSVIEEWARYSPNFSPGEIIVGDPDAERGWWNYQGAENSCAVVAQQGVLESILQRNLDREDLINMAEDKGWYDPEGGTMPSDVGNILEEFGIPVERGDGYEFSDIYQALANGEKVIVGANAHELWDPQQNPDGTSVQQDSSGHAVWVTGLVAREGDVYVVMNDSAPMSGFHKEVQLKDFLNAWEDYGNFAVITKMHA
jgi:hypothetical protein